MKIYFAGTIRAGRQDRGKYIEIIKVLQEFGQVLTEHIGSDLPETGEALPSADIFHRDRAWLESADLVVADVSTPSTGVGYEMGIAESLKIPIVCLYRRGSERRISGMVEGNPYVTILEYDIPEQVAPELRAVVTKFSR